MEESNLSQRGSDEEGKEVVVFKYGDKVIYRGEEHTVIGVEDGGTSFVSLSGKMQVSSPEINVHRQRLRLRDKWDQEICPVSGANCTKV